MSHRPSPVAVLLALSFVVAAPALARAFAGSGSLAGTSRLRVKGCGTYRADFATTLTVLDDGTLTAQVEEGAFAGSGTPLGRSGRKLALALDEPSTAALVASVVEDASELCESPATVTATQPKTLTLVLNRRLTKAKLVVKFVFKGTAAGVAGTATYKLVGRGPWTPG
jgi:hypothetical protein